MTSFYDFAASTVAPFQFAPTLDGEVCNVRVTWNLFGARYYINVYAADGSLVVCRALVGSPTGVALESLTWARGKVNATASAPHGYPLGRVIGLTISGATPDAYNGLVNALITGPDTFTYALAADPGMATVFGAASYNINLVGGYFTSTLVFRQSTKRFEVSP